MTMTRRRMLWLLGAGALGSLIVFFTVRRGLAQEPPSSAIEVDRERKEVRIRAVAHPSHFSRFLVQPGHHAVVWTKGRARYGALFESYASDRVVRAALVSLGAKAGENLTEATWNERKNARSGEPDRRVEGTPIAVLVEWPGSGGAVPLSEDPGARKAIFVRFPIRRERALSETLPVGLHHLRLLVPRGRDREPQPHHPGGGQTRRDLHRQ